MMKRIIIIALTVLLLTVGVALAGSGQKQMWLTDDRGDVNYIGSNVDPWLED